MASFAAPGRLQPRPPGAPNVRVERIATTDPDEYAARMRTFGINLRHNQISSGQYSIDLATVLVPQVRLSLVTYGPAMTSQGAMPNGRYALALQISGSRGAFLNHRSLREGEIGLLRPGHEFHLVRSAESRCVTVFPDAALIDRLADAMFGRPFSAIVRVGRAIPAADGALAAYARRIAKICNGSALGTGHSDAEMDNAERMGRDVVDALLGIIQPPEPLHGWSDRERIVRRAWEVVEADEQGAVTVSELCLRLAVPIRTLDDAFRACMGVTPKRLITTLRLNNVRRRLNRPRDETTITDAATRFGFYHFGHFAHQYRRLFGEVPSETLRRARS